MAPTTLCPSPSNACAPPDTSDNDLLLLSPDHIQQVAQFRDEIRRKTKPEKYELCVQVRNDLLEQHTGVQLLIAACEHVMFTHCTEYKDLKEARVKPSAMQSDPEWDRFLAVAEDSLERKSRCLSALKTVARHWGQDVVRHYLWAYKGVKYCHALCTAARKVPVYKIAAKGLSLSMLKRSREGPTLKRRPIRASPNPIEQSDLDYLSRHPPEDELAIELPDGFGFDKFGLVVCKEYAAVLPEPDDTGAEMPTQRGGSVTDDATGPSSPDGTGSIDLQERASASEPRTNSDTPTEDAATPLEGSKPNVGHDHHQLGAESAEDTVTVLQGSEINSHDHHPSAPPETSPVPHSRAATALLRAELHAKPRKCEFFSRNGVELLGYISCKKVYPWTLKGLNALSRLTSGYASLNHELSLALEGGSFTVPQILYLGALEKLAVCLRIIAGTFNGRRSGGLTRLLPLPD